MRNLRLMLVAAGLVVAFGVSPAISAEPVRKGAISDSMFASMGLGGMEQVSDHQGHKIRGQGFNVTQVNVAIVTVIGRNNRVNVDQANVAVISARRGRR